MGIKLFILVAGTAGVLGLASGYFLRWLVSLGKKGSVELRIKELELLAQENAKKITGEAEKRAAEMAHGLKQIEREKELAWKKTEERLVNKETLLDKRQTAFETELDMLRKKAEEIRLAKKNAGAPEGR